ncbi:MAG: hypothetical protein N3D14_04785 [Aquificaceae bacterium]|nr:hypothetical protein [Aquificaceae bacterium]
MPAVSWSYEVVPKKGIEYRRVDVQIVKLEKYQVYHPDSRISFKTHISPEGTVKIELANKSSEHLRDIIITQNIEGRLDGLVRARRMISKNPLIVEDFITAPYHMDGNQLYIGIPALSSGEELQLEYRVLSSVIYKPILASPTIKKDVVQERVVKKYSFYFPIGGVELDRRAIEKLLVEVNLLPLEDGYRIKVKGYADAIGRHSTNMRIARARAEGLANLMVRESLACLEKGHYAGSLTGTFREAR